MREGKAAGPSRPRGQAAIVPAWLRFGVALAAVAVVTAMPALAEATTRIYWTNFIANTISYANIGGSGSGSLETSGATVDMPIGLAIDSASGRIYWASFNADKISYADLGGNGGGDLNTGSATISGPSAVAIDPASGRIYWTNFSAIPAQLPLSYANLDGSGGGDLDTGSATVSGADGVAVDPAAGRIYWANFYANKISYADLGGNGGGDLDTGSATPHGPQGLAIDTVGGRIFWGNAGADTISYANLDGSGGGNLDTGSATVHEPVGIAYDPVADRVYWANADAAKISYANLDGGGGGDLDTGSAPINGPVSIAMQSSPTAGAPTISGGSTSGSELTCDVAWAQDLPGSFYYREPRFVTYAWKRNGAAIPGATGPTYTAAEEGSYTCLATGVNGAGSETTGESAPHLIRAAPSPPSDTSVLIRIRGKTVRFNRKGRGRLRLECPASEASPPCTGTLTLRTQAKLRFHGKRRRVTLARASFKLGAGEAEAVSLALSRAIRRLLAGSSRARQAVAIVKARDAAGNRATARKALKLMISR